MRQRHVTWISALGLCAAAIVVAVGRAETPTEAYAKGCAGCHPSERSLLRNIPRLPPTERRAWIGDFMAKHPNERASLRDQIIEYLMERTGP